MFYVGITLNENDRRLLIIFLICPDIFIQCIF